MLKYIFNHIVIVGQKKNFYSELPMYRTAHSNTIKYMNG